MRFDNTFRDRKDFNFEVRRERLTLRNDHDTGIDALVREDTGDFISAVSPKYKVTTHKEANAFAERLFERAGLEIEEGHVAVDRKGARFLREFRLVGKSFIPGSVNSTAADYSGNTDQLIPTLLLRNSYDRSSSLDFTFGAFRMVCSNGMVIPATVVKTLRFKHTELPDYDSIAAALHQGLEQTIVGYKEMYERLNSSTANPYLRLLMQHAIVNARMAELLRFNTGGLVDFTLDDEGNLADIRASTELSAYALMNIMTEYATHHLRKYTRSVDLQQKIARVFQ